MFRLLHSAMAISCALLLSACAQPAEVTKPAFVTSDIVTERATVLAVNRPGLRMTRPMQGQ